MEIKKIFLLFLSLTLVILCHISPTVAADWGSIFIDSQFSNFSSSVGRYSSLALDSSGYAHIVYFNESEYLKYATNISGTWQISTVDNGGKVGRYCSMAIDTNDNLHVSYFDTTNWDLKYATNSAGVWTTTTVDSSGNVGHYSSIAVDSTGNVHISYFDLTNGNLKYAVKNSDRWTTSTLDDNGVTGLSTSIGIDSSNKIHICYLEDKSNYPASIVTPPYTYNLKYITNASGSWSSVTVFTPTGSADWAYGMYSTLRNINSSIVIDSSDFVHIAHRQLITDDLIYATNKTGVWSSETIDDSGDVGFHASISIDSANKIHISYHDATNSILKYITNISGSWVIETVDNSDLSGVYSSIALDSSGAVHISYAYTTNQSCFNCGGSKFLKYANNTPYTYQFESGEWWFATSGNSVTGHTSCLPEPNQSGKVQLERDGKNITVTFEDIKFTGIIENEGCKVAAVFMEYPLPNRIIPEPNITYLSDGLMRFDFDLSATSATDLSGKISWSWSYGDNLKCNGQSNVILSRSADPTSGNNDSSGGSGGGGGCFIGSLGY